jgi:hypothetical protein
MCLEVAEFLQDLLCLSLVVPKLRLRGDLFEILNFGVESRKVKDSPEFYPGDQTAVLPRV